MKKLGVISRIEEPSNWSAGIVVVPKENDRIRTCVDLTHLNRAVKRDRHVLPSVGHIIAQLGDAKIFFQVRC